MNKIVTLPTLTSLLADITGKDKAVCEQFVLTLTRLVGDAIIADGSLKIPGLGVFAVDEMRTKVVLTPDKSIAARINAPFEIFEPVALAPNATPQMLGMSPDPANGKMQPDAPPVFYDFFFSHEK